MYLINAICFKGDWTTQFDKSLTRAAPFQLTDGTATTVPMMSLAAATDVPYHADDGVTVLDLPYGGQAFSMTIVLPRGRRG